MNLLKSNFSHLLYHAWIITLVTFLATPTAATTLTTSSNNLSHFMHVPSTVGFNDVSTMPLTLTQISTHSSLGRNLLVGLGCAALSPCFLYVASAIIKTLSPDLRAITSYGSFYLRNDTSFWGPLKTSLSNINTLVSIPQGTKLPLPDLLLLAQLRLYACNWFLFDLPAILFVGAAASKPLATAFTCLSLVRLGWNSYQVVNASKNPAPQILEAKNTSSL
ncbi:TPA: hypothetical protein DDZ86_01810 [Candidatus Dependentiae bacterium]|nr:MAG: hypothetical protein UW09_C0001G0275 [candidate division TM6 bacterium GW2011_GWF2_43_87]HBL98360.1 hypothetical protein [Candidatus Dependentiae bacterium]